MITNPKSSTTEPQASNEFWQSILPNDFHMLEVAPDGSCLFRCILDQLNHDEGARHEFMLHQITNHISRNGNAFKDFLLLQDNHEDVSDLNGYLQKMDKNGAWGGHTEVYGMLQPGFMASTSLFMQRSMLYYWWKPCFQGGLTRCQLQCRSHHVVFIVSWQQPL